LLLGLLAILSALGLILYTTIQERQLAASEAQKNAPRLVRLVSSEHKELIEGTRQLFIALAQLPAVCHYDLAKVKAKRSGIDGAWFFI